MHKNFNDTVAGKVLKANMSTKNIKIKLVCRMNRNTNCAICYMRLSFRTVWGGGVTGNYENQNLKERVWWSDYLPVTGSVWHSGKASARVLFLLSSVARRKTDTPTIHV